MSNQADINPQTNLPVQPPPGGNSEKADHYLNQLIDLINTDKLLVIHTDLSKFDPSSLQDHYRLNLGDYEVEVSHSKQPNTGKDHYVLIFNNLKQVSQNATEKIILAYIHISDDKFTKFKIVANDQIERKRREAEEKRFREAMAPIDQALNELVEVNAETNKEQPEELSDHLDDPLSNHPPVFAVS